MADTWECAYAAGLFDGEGCVQLYMRTRGTYRDPEGPNNSFTAMLTVAGVDRAPLDWLMERWGGRIGIIPRQNPHRSLAMWRITSTAADVFARDIKPFLIIKRDEMDLWIRARAMMYKPGSRGTGPQVLPPDEVAERRDLVARLKDLKRQEYKIG